MPLPTIPASKLKGVRDLLLREEGLSPEGWWWVGEKGLKSLSKKSANKFLFACIVDYQMKAEVIWQHCADFTQIELADPDSLWEVVASTPLPKWLTRTKKFNLHRFPKAHERLWRIGKRVCEEYDGDARRIWQDRDAAEVVEAFEALGLGPNLSRMATGGLMDTGWIKGRGDVKADIHVCRVIGRVFLGEAAHPGIAVELARRIYPENPWKIDGPLFQVGQYNCRANAPECSGCILIRYCSYARANQ